MDEPKCSVADCSRAASIYLSSIERRAIVSHLAVCREHTNDLLARERQKVVSDRPARADYAGMANVDLRLVLFDCAKQPHEGPATIELSEVGATRRLVIGRIGFCEAWALDTALRQLAVPRPLTHPLTTQIIDALGARVDRVVIDRLVRAQQIYCAKLHISHGTRLVFVDCRPSDAFVIAVICGAPIFVARDLLGDQQSWLELD
jgi:bifunctional DNase/RNase